MYDVCISIFEHTHTYVYILGERERGEGRGSQAIQGSLLRIGEGNSETVPQRLIFSRTLGVSCLLEGGQRLNPRTEPLVPDAGP